MSKEFKITASAHAMRPGDLFTISGVLAPDKRSRWRKALDWVMRRPPPTRPLTTFRVVTTAVSSASAGVEVE